MAVNKMVVLLSFVIFSIFYLFCDIFGPREIQDVLMAEKKSTNLLLYVAIFSANRRTDRRAAIRKTWFRECRATAQAECRFFADKLDENGEKLPESALLPLRRESEENGDDIVLLDSPAGMNFAVRTIIVMEYLLNISNFEFLLRIDDDQFLCFDRLVKELPYRPKEGLYWGYTHCLGKSKIYIIIYNLTLSRGYLMSVGRGWCKITLNRKIEGTT